MIGPVKTTVPFEIAEGFRHEFRLFFGDRCCGVMRTEPPDAVLSWSGDEAATHAEMSVKLDWLEATLRWIENENAK